MKDARGHGSNARGGSNLSTPDQHQRRIAIDTVKNPLKGTFLGGPNAAEAEATLRNKFGWNDADINRIKGFQNEPKLGGPGSSRGAPVGSASSSYWTAKSLVEGVSDKQAAGALAGGGAKSTPVDVHPSMTSAQRADAAGSPNYRGSGTGPGGIGERKLTSRKV